jgi:hypothetical protein
MQVAYIHAHTLRTHGRFYCYLDLGLPRAFLLGNDDGRIMYSAVLLHQDKGLILGKLVFLQADRYRGFLSSVLAAWDLLLLTSL